MAKNRSQIDVLPDDVLLEIFCFYVDATSSYQGKRGTEAWQTLVHVCRPWRRLVFLSPRRLNLQLYCTPQTTAKKLNAWPALPLILRGNMTPSSSTDNVIAVLGQSDRILHVCLLDLAGSQIEKVLARMQVSFPEMIDLQLSSDSETSPVVPDSFLGGSTPNLQFLELGGITFPGLPKLLLTTTHLAQLWLNDIPHFAFISPAEMVTLLSNLSSLDTLSLGFRSPQSLPGWKSRSLPVRKRSTLALRRLHFKGITEYLEGLMTRIDTPQLRHMDITFFNQIDFDCPRLAHFINRTPTLRTLNEARVRFDDNTVNLRYRTSSSGFESFMIAILCSEPDWQLSSLEQACNSSLPPLSTVEDLYITERYMEIIWKDEAMENSLWLQLFLRFTAVKNLYLSVKFAPGIAAALEELVGDRIAEVLPCLETIFVEGFEPWGRFQHDTGQFVAARQFSSHPVAISLWKP